MVEEITYQILTESLLQDMIDIILKQQTLSAVSRYESLKDCVKNEEDVQLAFKIGKPGKDIFGQDRDKVKATETSRYFQCENCSRSIAASRFASHISKCLERRKR